jgi:ADP-ribose pyrophosphatase YjhB (NUDIX family)
LFLINDKNEVLVAVRAHNPGKGGFDVPGGFCDDYETYEAALERELIEEISLTPAQYSIPQYLTSALDRYNYDGETINVLSAVFWSRIKGIPELKPQDDVASVQFIPIESLDAGQFYFNAIQVGFRQLYKTLT